MTERPQEIVENIQKANQREDLDLLIVGRGGGSIEDLWAFNEEIVVQSIFESRLPVISSDCHETDTTLADFVADVGLLHLQQQLNLLLRYQRLILWLGFAKDKTEPTKLV